MNADSRIIYEAVRDAWLIRLREIDIRGLYGPHCTCSTIPKTQEPMAGMANPTDDNQLSPHDSVFSPRTSTEISRTSFKRRRA